MAFCHGLKPAKKRKFPVKGEGHGSIKVGIRNRNYRAIRPALAGLWVMIDLVNPDLLTRARISHLIRFMPEEMRSPAIGITVFCLVYLVGSMITPVACQFLNDSDMLGKILPTEEKI